MKVVGVFSSFSPPDFAAIARMIRLGLPIGVTVFLEMAMFSMITLLIGRLGVEAVAAHQIAASVGGMTFMVPLALGMAVSIRVGFNVGAGDLVAARRSGWGQLVYQSSLRCLLRLPCTMQGPGWQDCIRLNSRSLRWRQTS